MADSSSNADAPGRSAVTTANGENNSNATNGRSRDERGGRFEGRGGRGGRGGGGRGRGQSQGRGRGNSRGFGGKDRGGRQNKGDMGRGEYNRSNVDKRKRNDESREKRQKDEASGEAVANSLYTKEEIEAEGRKPKRKVAVLIGYAGTGYKGMQINSLEKTIEGDLFDAFVKAGAISKANADDPKKSSLVRCARTDKGVHAAGNVISLKLIVEDPKIVDMINEHLPPQIRVWGMERTNGSFSCYQTCDSRWYEYLIPTFAFLPPHPQSYLGKKLVESAEKEGVYETYQARQADAASFWESTEATYVKTILDRLDPNLRAEVIATIHKAEEDEPQASSSKRKRDVDEDDNANSNKKVKPENENFEDAVLDGLESNPAGLESDANAKDAYVGTKLDTAEADVSVGDELRTDVVETTNNPLDNELTTEGTDISKAKNPKSVLTPLDAAVKEIKAAYISAKKAYRISDQRRGRVQEALNAYLGTRNFHNYTIQKRFSDPSAKRLIRSFNVGKDPVIINDTEWLSLKVHGQSFMMHQIRKMVAMAAMVVRCGSPISIMQESYGPATISIPKAPGLGLLLERPVFETYNERAEKEYSKEKIDFDKFKDAMEEFKQREIYDRIFREEERDHQFHAFFHHIDNYKTDYFLWATASGMSAAKQSQSQTRKDDGSDDEVDVNGQEG